MMFVNRSEGLCDPQPQSAQVLRTLLVSAELTADEISRNKQSRHHGELRRMRLRTVTTLAQVWGRAAPSVSLIGSALCEC